MWKKITLVVLISISILVTGCGSKKVETQSNSSVQSNSNSSPNSRINNEQETNKTTTPSSKAVVSKSDYSSYSGSFVTESSLIDDFQYGIVVSISVDKEGNIKGVVSDATENLSHISSVEIKGKIKDNSFIADFAEDGWGHGGRIKLDFKDNKLVLTINYSANSSKDNSWGIGEGTFTLINSNTKVTRTLDNLKDGGLQVIDKQCFSVNLENYGKVKFISGLKRENSNDNVNFYLINDKNNVLYKFTDFYGNSKGMFNNINAVSFADVNKDSLKDIIVIADYSASGIPTTICSIYLQKGKAFINNKSFDDKMNSSSNNKDIATVLKYAKENLLK